MSLKNSLPELLAPAGTMASLEAAIQGGADAVYFGAGSFNARMRAGNFQSEEEICRAVKLCRAFGVKAYAAVNTRIYDSELYSALELCRQLYNAGVHGIIAADVGLCTLVRKYIPELELHASTQLSGHTIADAEAFSELGFSRMVCPREISREELKRLCAASPIEIEMFVHGAYCVSFSGQCLMSAAIGGRSGNRGECAQPCRQPYSLSGKKPSYPISLKDMCLAGHVKSLIDSGVASLKIEGRQKKPEYVYGVCKIYRRLLDQRRNATENEMNSLEALFSRGGFSDGYYTGKADNMLGVRTYDDYLAMDKTPFPGLTRKIGADIVLYAESGQRARLCVSTPYASVAVCGDRALDSSVSATDPKKAEEKVGRLGGTPFELKSFRFITDGSGVTLSEINALRRLAVEKLTNAGRITVGPIQAQLIKKRFDKDLPRKKEKAAVFRFASSITEKAEEYFSRIYLPFGEKGAGRGGRGVLLPTAFFDAAGMAIWDSLEDLRRKNGDFPVLVNTEGQLREAVRRGFRAECSLRMNVFNSETVRRLSGLGAFGVTYAPELTIPRMRDMPGAAGGCLSGAVVYGRLPLMYTVRCPISDGGAECPHGRTGFAEPSLPVDWVCRGAVRDRKGVEFPIIADPGCGGVIYNSAVVWMADRTEQIDISGAPVSWYLFSDEGPRDADFVIEAYKNRSAAPEDTMIKRI